MRALITCFALASIWGVASASAQSLSDADVAAAIKAGESKKFDNLVSSCQAGAGFGESLGANMAGGVQRTGTYVVTFSLNQGRIAFMAANAKRLYKTLTLDQVGEELRSPTVFVSVEPSQPSTTSNTISVPALIEHVVLKSKAKSEMVVQPLKVDTEPVEWSNLLGGKVEGNRAVARFDSNAVRELPPGDFDVVVVTPNGERRCKVGAKDRRTLLPG